MALKKAPVAEPKSPAPAAVAVAEPVIETPVPVDSGAAEQTPALQPDEPVVITEADVAAATVTSAEITTRAEVDQALATRIGALSTKTEAAVAETLKEPEPEVEPEPVAEKERFIEVVNLRKTAFRQPSTGLWIQAGEVKYLANDGWLENHVRANLLGQPED